MDKKKLKVYIVTFLVLGITGIAILKGKDLMDKIRNKKQGRAKGRYDKMFDLPESLK